MERIDLERARRDAKALLRAARSGDASALARMRADRTPVLADAQHAVAVELGFSSWPALVSGVRGEALLEAAREGSADAVYRALMDGAPANARDDAGRTALHLAATAGWADVVDVLVGWVPVERDAVDAAGRTPWSQDPVVARMLVSGGVPAPPGFAWRRPEVEVDAALGETAFGADAALFEFLAGSRLAARRPVGDGFAFRTGLPDNTRNGVVCSRVEDVSEAIAWMGGQPAQWLVGPESSLGERLERAGCRPERTAVLMAARFDSHAATAQDGDEAVVGAAGAIVRIRDEATLRAAMEAVGALESDAREAALLASLGFDGPMRHHAALQDGVPVGLVSTFAWRDTLTGTALAVAPHCRRQGIGRALVGHVARGLTLLAPTTATIPFYAALGFRLLRFPPDRVFYLPV